MKSTTHPGSQTDSNNNNKKSSPPVSLETGGYEIPQSGILLCFELAASVEQRAYGLRFGGGGAVNPPLYTTEPLGSRGSLGFGGAGDGDGWHQCLYGTRCSCCTSLTLDNPIAALP